MTNTNDLSSRINDKYKSMSKGQKLLAAYIMDNYDKAVFLTAAKLGTVVGVSESTVVRFATNLGYKGYPEFQQALEELVRNKLNSIQRMEVTYGRISQSKILETVLQSDTENLKGTLENLNQGAVHGLADVPARAVASVVLYVKRLVAFWRGSEFRRGRRGVGVSVVIACELVKLNCGRGGRGSCRA